MIEANSLGATPGWDSSRWSTGTDGQLTDPSPDRRTDAYVPVTVPMSPAVEADLHDSAALDALLPVLAARYPGMLRSGELRRHRHLLPERQPGSRATTRLPACWSASHPTSASRPASTQASPALDPERKRVVAAAHGRPGAGPDHHGLDAGLRGQTYRGVIGVDLSVAKLVEQVNDSKVDARRLRFYVDKNGVLLRSDSYDACHARLDDGNDPALNDTIYQMKRGPDRRRPPDYRRQGHVPGLRALAVTSAAASPSSRPSI